MSEDVDDTVIVPPRAARVAGADSRAKPDLDDTLIPEPDPHSLAEMAQPSTASIALPTVAFHSFRIGEHERTFLLDRPCVVGRRPSAPRVVSGAPPRLIRVPSPLKEVSSSHLEVRQVGGSVVVTDLRSTNGSVVMLPGSVPRKLLQGESVVVSPGTLVDIGDDNIIQILPTQRPVTGAGRQP